MYFVSEGINAKRKGQKEEQNFFPHWKYSFTYSEIVPREAFQGSTTAVGKRKKKVNKKHVHTSVVSSLDVSFTSSSQLLWHPALFACILYHIMNY